MVCRVVRPSTSPVTRTWRVWSNCWRNRGRTRYLVTDGDPDSPSAPSETGFPAGSGLPLERITEAVREFVRTRRLPGAVPWRAVGG
ncbi:Imm1 family immunity protein [Amycolatopsis sp. ATCC 39116]|uniref:Imm1 family immunity protein n=1 Tax=Amycolatopsis sp. (strain ATCC 39116 / 75iv2) TaxID=385957 RepID=UPI000A05F481